MNIPNTPQFYTCPMHPEIRKNSPGLCSECGMNLVEKKSNKHTNHKMGAGLLTKFWISALLTIPVFLYSELPERFFNWQAPQFSGSEYFSLVLGSIVFFYGGLIFLTSAVRELKARSPGMMTLISLAIIVSYTYSVYVVFSGSGKALFWELTSLISVMLIGHWIEMKSVQSAQGALRELSKLLPDTAEVILNGKTKTIPLVEIKIGDIIFIRPGGRIPADSIVTEGTSNIDESMITGESKPVKKEIGSELIGGTINHDGSLNARVSKIGDDTFLSGVMRLVEQAQASKSKIQLLSDRAAYYLTIVAISTGIIAFLVWLYIAHDFAFAITRLVAVLVIACPHALGLAIPLVASISTTKAAKNGFLVRERRALETARNINTVLFDKTGTLTKGEYGVEQIIPINTTLSVEEIIQRAASIDSHSEHFIARAIVNYANANTISLVEVKNFERVPGKGVRGNINESELFVGGRGILEFAKDKLPENIQTQSKTAEQQGKTTIFVIQSQELIGLITLSDIIREESREAIKSLQDMGVSVGMITGDSEGVATWVSKELGITEYFANVLPGEKSEKVQIIQKQGKKVAMVGDGINDAPALTQADLGIAIGAGTNVAIESAEIILMKNDPRDIVKIIKLSRMTYSKMIQNLFWASGYNVVAIPLAAGLLFSQGILLQPAFAAILMSFSTVIVAFNALLLKWKKLV